jgi:hypothetical protein
MLMFTQPHKPPRLRHPPSSNPILNTPHAPAGPRSTWNTLSHAPPLARAAIAPVLLGVRLTVFSLTSRVSPEPNDLTVAVTASYKQARFTEASGAQGLDGTEPAGHLGNLRHRTVCCRGTMATILTRGLFRPPLQPLFGAVRPTRSRF